MQKEIATLQVILDDSKNTGVVNYKDSSDYTLFINPNELTDSPVFRNLQLPIDAKRRSAIAHELGHFLGYLTQETAHANLASGLGKDWITNDAITYKNLLPAEKAAWDLAKEIAPVEPEMREAALQTYRDGGYR